MEENNLIVNIYEYGETPFQLKCRTLINEIYREFDNFGFMDEYKKYLDHEIDKNSLNKYIYNVLIDVNQEKKYDLNEMYGMLSETNCGWTYFEVGNLIHEQLMRIWYPKDHTEK